MVACIDPKSLDEVFLELRLKLQIKGFYSNQIKDYFFKPYQSEAPVSIKKLRDMFEFNGFSDKKAELLSRYLIEPKDQKGQIEFDEERSASQRTVIAHLEESVGHYKVYQAADTQALTKKVQRLLTSCRDTLKETLELEDYDEEGAIPLSAMKESFQTLDITELTEEPSELLDFILYIVY